MLEDVFFRPTMSTGLFWGLVVVMPLMRFVMWQVIVRGMSDHME